ncbi:hypothetical protein DdX_12920 [Ditylenchus destructor]|uniref:Uncharacterized protein n=1 Tax=Ditylenchus destructor TaxID=166010 RepID=A0AAD4R3A6_9BILA|nr:hypothetical protein DdX_12920 [Ditylenchus destructor]
MNIQCCVCTARKIATSFNSLDELQAHLFSHHHEGRSTALRFLCRNCRLDFATEYRLLKHKEKCESRNAENTEDIRYELQIFKWIEESLKFSMTKNRIPGVQTAKQCDFETPKTQGTPQMERQPTSAGLGRIKSESAERLEHAASSSRRDNAVMQPIREKTVTKPSAISNESKNFKVKRDISVKSKGKRDQNCSDRSKASIQSKSKVEIQEAITPEIEITKTVESKLKRKSKSAELASGGNLKIQIEILASELHCTIHAS